MVLGSCLTWFLVSCQVERLHQLAAAHKANRGPRRERGLEANVGLDLAAEAAAVEERLEELRIHAMDAEANSDWRGALTKNEDRVTEAVKGLGDDPALAPKVGGAWYAFARFLLRAAAAAGQPGLGVSANTGAAAGAQAAGAGGGPSSASSPGGRAAGGHHHRSASPAMDHSTLVAKVRARHEAPGSVPSGPCALPHWRRATAPALSLTDTIPPLVQPPPLVVPQHDRHHHPHHLTLTPPPSPTPPPPHTDPIPHHHHHHHHHHH